MKKCSRRLAAPIAAAVVLLASAAAAAETVKLKLIRLEPVSPAGAFSSADYIYRVARPQQFIFQPGAKQKTIGVLESQGLPVVGGPQFKESPDGFSKVVTKQPERYQAEHPLRAVAKLGSGKYGFVLDCKDAKSKQYCRLLFDLNHNGDLTDDKVIEGKPMEGRFPDGYAVYQFPRVDLTIDVDGAKVDYSFFFTTYSGALFGGAYSSGESEDSGTRSAAYVMAGLQAAAYREGQLQMGGKAKRIVLLDFNSNGRFDDQVQPPQGGNMRTPFAYGDVLLVDPQPAGRGPVFSTTDLMGSQVAKLIQVDGDLFDLKVSPSGDRLTVTPSSVPIGHVKLPCEGLSATVYGELGLLKIGGQSDKPVALPAGQWKLLSYTIDQTESWKAQQKETQSSPEENSLLKTFAGALIGSASSGSASRTTRITASGSGDGKVMTVRGGQTVPLPFGPPYRPVVKASAALRGGQPARLSLSLVGAGGEDCTQLMVDGKRPAEPQFTISTPDGEEVASGKFEWG